MTKKKKKLREDGQKRWVIIGMCIVVFGILAFCVALFFSGISRGM